MRASSYVCLNESYFHFLAENLIDILGCNENEFACFDEDNECLDRSAVCDGIPDCSNGSDEIPSRCNCTTDQVSLMLCLTEEKNRMSYGKSASMSSNLSFSTKSKS